MHLNEVQRKTLRDVLKLTGDAILETGRVDLLRRCIAVHDVKLSSSALRVLGHNASLYSALLPAGQGADGVYQVAIPAQVRLAWAVVHRVIRGEVKASLLNDLVESIFMRPSLQAESKDVQPQLQLLAQTPNYDPCCLAQLHTFEQRLLDLNAECVEILDRIAFLRLLRYRASCAW
jgi:hypothetical protein